MPVSVLRSVLPAVTSVIATLWLATAVPHGLAPEVAAAADGQALAGRAEEPARDAAASRQASRQ